MGLDRKKLLRRALAPEERRAVTPKSEIGDIATADTLLIAGEQREIVEKRLCPVCGRVIYLVMGRGIDDIDLSARHPDCVVEERGSVEAVSFDLPEARSGEYVVAAAWLRANGIDVSRVPQGSEIVVGSDVLEYERYALDEEGAMFYRNGGIAREKASVPLAFDIPDSLMRRKETGSESA